jgi:predicted nucleic acid-binding protein
VGAIAVRKLAEVSRRADALSSQQLHVPLADSVVASVLRRRVAARKLDANAGWAAMDTWRRLGLTRYPVFAFSDRELRDNLSAYDASFIALAELLDCDLLTADARLGGAPGIRCAITLVPR